MSTEQTDEIQGKKFKRADPANFMQDGALVFDAEDCERFIVVKIGKLPQSLGGGSWEGKLYEAGGDQRDMYITELSGRMKRDSEGRPMGLTTAKGVHALLLKHTLINDSDGKAAKPEWIGALPAHVTQVLYDYCRTMSAIGEEAVAKVGEN
jgi:hypothetical protein